MISHLRTWFDDAGSMAQAVVGVGVLIALLATAFVLWHSARQAIRGAKPENVLTVVAAAMATSVASTGMWHFFERTMQLPVYLRAVLFAFMEVAVLAEALRARANVKALGEAGLDGKAVWVLTILSGSMSATEAGSVRASIVRFTSPLVAAWLWERSLVPERRAARPQRTETVRWIFDIKRIAVRLGLATALDSGIESADANLRIDRYMRAKKRADIAGWLTRRWRARQAARAETRLMQRARLNADPLPLYKHLGNQSILEVLAALGGKDAVLSSDLAAQMAEVLDDGQPVGGGGPSGEPPATDEGDAREVGENGPSPAAAWIPQPRPGAASGHAGALISEPGEGASADGEQGADVGAASLPPLPAYVDGPHSVLPGSAGKREAGADSALPGSADSADEEQGRAGGEAADGEGGSGRRRASGGKVSSDTVRAAFEKLAASGQPELPTIRQIHGMVGGRWGTVTSAIDALGGREKVWEQARTQALTPLREPVLADR